MKLSAVLETCLYASNLITAEAFYSRVLGLTRLDYDPERHIFYRLEQAMLLIFNPHATTHAGGSLPPHGSLGSTHVAFAVAATELESWIARLETHHVPLERRLTWPHGGQSVYFRDPAQNSLELATPQMWGFVEATVGEK